MDTHLQKPEPPPKAPKPPMSTAQKISLLVCVFSLVVFLASAYDWGILNGELKWENVFGQWANQVFDNDGYYINYIGLITLGSTIASLVGYFILGDKKK